jgi:hypothetical protein
LSREFFIFFDADFAEDADYLTLGHERICLSIFDAYHPTVLISRQIPIDKLRAGYLPHRLKTFVRNMLSHIKPNSWHGFRLRPMGYAGQSAGQVTLIDAEIL